MKVTAKVTSLFSVSQFRGYTCGLWTSFHFFFAHATDESSGPLAHAIADVILNHFKCLECRDNFRAEIETFPLDTVTDQDSGILWLWSLHNSGTRYIISTLFNSNLFFFQFSTPSQVTLVFWLFYTELGFLLSCPFLCVFENFLFFQKR